MCRMAWVLVAAVGCVCLGESDCRAQATGRRNFPAPRERLTRAAMIAENIGDRPTEELRISYAALRPADLQAEQQIVRALEQPIALNFEGQPLKTAVNAFASQTGIVCTLDLKACEAAGVSPDAPVSVGIPSNVSARAHLEQMLKPLQMTWIVHNQTLCVTTSDEANNRMTVRVYPVADLVLFTDGTPDGGSQRADFDSLIQVITNSIQPSSWDEVGGQGSVKGFDPSLSLVVAQTRDVHEELEQLLLALRKSRNAQPLARAYAIAPAAVFMPEGDSLDEPPLPAYRATIRQRGGGSAAAWQLPRTADDKTLRVRSAAVPPVLKQSISRSGGAF